MILRRVTTFLTVMLLALGLYGNIAIDENVWHAFVLTFVITSLAALLRQVILLILRQETTEKDAPTAMDAPNKVNR